MINNIIRVNDITYIVTRKLPANTPPETATKIHEILGTDTLLRNKEGVWFCCVSTTEVEYRMGKLEPRPEKPEFSHTQFELGDNGGLG